MLRDKTEQRDSRVNDDDMRVSDTRAIARLSRLHCVTGPGLGSARESADLGGDHASALTVPVARCRTFCAAKERAGLLALPLQAEQDRPGRSRQARLRGCSLHRSRADAAVETVAGLLWLPWPRASPRCPEPGAERRRLPAVSSLPRISYARSADGVSLAFTAVGSGPALVFLPPVPFSNLRMEWQNPLLRNAFEQLARRLTVVHYDGRGTGHSQRDVSDLSLEAMVSDLVAVADRAGLAEVSLVGQYNSCPHAIAYAARCRATVPTKLLQNIRRSGADPNMSW